MWYSYDSGLTKHSKNKEKLEILKKPRRKIKIT
jgi:hypothetical protein